MAQDRSEQYTTDNNIMLQANLALEESYAETGLQQLPLATPQKDAGLNPLVDAAARLFSIIGKLQQLKTCQQPEQLHTDLLAEVNAFQTAAKAQNYAPEHILASRYAICATLDDVIAQTPWGAASAWQPFRQEEMFGTESSEHERFFLILDRIFKSPNEHIDLMEFMYICLSLGFRGNYQSTEFGHQKLEQISDALYRQIRAHHGDFSRTLSPLPIKARSISNSSKLDKFSPAVVLLSTATLILIVFVSLGLALDAFTNKTQTQLAEIGTTLTHENSHS